MMVFQRVDPLVNLLDLTIGINHGPVLILEEASVLIGCKVDEQVVTVDKDGVVDHLTNVAKDVLRSSVGMHIACENIPVLLTTFVAIFSVLDPHQVSKCEWNLTTSKALDLFEVSFLVDLLDHFLCFDICGLSTVVVNVAHSFILRKRQLI